MTVFQARLQTTYMYPQRLGTKYSLSAQEYVALVQETPAKCQPSENLVYLELKLGMSPLLVIKCQYVLASLGIL